MAFPPLTMNGQPNPEAMYLGAFMCTALDKSEIDPGGLGTIGINQIQDFFGVGPSQGAIGRLQAGLGHTAADMAMRSFGANSGIWQVNKRLHRVDFCTYFSEGTLYVCCYGTENLTQLLDYISSVIPIYDDDFQAWVMPWASTQAIRVLAYIGDAGIWRSPNVNRVILVGHSLGGAVAYTMSRMLPRIREFQRVDVLTFGEPKSIGAGGRWHPNEHVRIVCAAQQQNVFADSRFDPVVLLPPQVVTAPFLGAALNTPYVGRFATGAARAGLRTELGLVPIQHGEEFCYDRQGTPTTFPLGAATRFLADLVLGPLGIADAASYHVLVASYLPLSFRRYLMSGSHTMDSVENFTRSWITGIPVPLGPLTPAAIASRQARGVDAPLPLSVPSVPQFQLATNVERVQTNGAIMPDQTDLWQQRAVALRQQRSGNVQQRTLTQQEESFLFYLREAITQFGLEEGLLSVGLVLRDPNARNAFIPAGAGRAPAAIIPAMGTDQTQPAFPSFTERAPVSLPVNMQATGPQSTPLTQEEIDWLSGVEASNPFYVPRSALPRARQR